MKKHIYIAFILWIGALFGAFPQSMIISGGTDHGVIICSEGYLYAWGKNESNRLGLVNPAGDNATKPERVNTPAGMTFSQVTAGSGGHTLALSCKGIVFAWGGNDNKECGPSNGRVVAIPTPVPHGAAPGYNLDGERNPNYATNPNDPAYPYLGGVKYVCGSTNSSFAILETGEAVGWGGGAWRTGLGDTDSPVYIRRDNATTGAILQNVIHIGTGDNNIYVLIDPDGDGLGDLYAMGEFLGRGANVPASPFAVPVMNGETNPPSPLTNIKMAIGMDVGGFAVDGVLGYVYAWGGSWGCSNGKGPYMNDNPYAMRVPSGMYKAITGEDYLADVVEVIGGNGYGAAVTKEGYMLYWGNNNPTGSGGVLPNGNTGDHTCNTGPQFAVYCTGKNTTSEVDADNPLQNTNLVKDAVRLSRGDLFGFMVNDKNDFYVWGRNAAPGQGADVYGMMGVGETSDMYVAQCLQKLEIPTNCGVPDRCPEAYMVGPLYKCAEDTITLFSGFASPVGMDENNNPLTDRYYFTWYDKDGKKLNTTDKNSPVAARRADKYNNTEMKVSKPGVYKVEIEYIDSNTPCDLCKPVSAQAEVRNKEMPVESLIDSSCVTNALQPSAGDIISFKFNSLYATGAKKIPSKFEVYTNATGGTPLTLTDNKTSVDISDTNPSGKFQVTGDKIAPLANGGVIENTGQDTLYTIWIEDKTTESGTVLKEQTLTDGAGGFQGRRILLEVWKPISLVSFDVILTSHFGTKQGTITPVIYAVDLNNGHVCGDELFRGTPQQVSYTTNTQVTVNVNIDLPANTMRGSRYYLGLIDAGIDQFSYAVIGENQQNSTLFTTETIHKDDLDESTLLIIGAVQNSGAGNPGNQSIFSNIAFNSLSTYDCGRIKLTSRYWCLPCQRPDEVNGKRVTIIPSIEAINDTVRLCEGDILELKTEMLKLNNTESNIFDILWVDSPASTTATQTDSKASTSTRDAKINWSDITPGTSKTYYVKVRDNEKPSPSCFVFDSIIVKANPKPEITNTPLTEEICSNTNMQAVELKSNVNGATFDWESKTSSTDISGNTEEGSGNLPADKLKNESNAKGTVTYTITPSANGCVGIPKDYAVTVNPIPAAPDVTSHQGCPTQTSDIRNWTSLIKDYNASNTYEWYDNDGNPATAPTTFNTNSNESNATYKIKIVVDNCPSDLSEPMVVNIDEEPQTPVIAPEAIKCAVFGSAPKNWSDLAAAGVGGTYDNLFWYDSDQLEKAKEDAATEPGKGLEVNALSGSNKPTTYPTDVAHKKDYYVVIEKDGCKTNPALVSVDINARPTATISGDNIICNGTETKLKVEFTGKQPYKFIYNDGNVNSAEITAASASEEITIQPEATTTYTPFSLKDDNGCEAAATDLTGSAAITVNDKPAFTAGISAAPVCSELELAEPAKPTPNWNGTAAGSLEWKLEGSSDPISFPLEVTHSTHNSKSIYYIAVNDCGADTTKNTLTVYELPTIALDPQPSFCEGDENTTLNLTLSGYTIKWIDTEPAIENLTAGNNPNRRKYTVIDGNNCEGKEKTYEVEVAAIPSAPTVNNEIRYQRDDAKNNGGKFKDPQTHDPNAVTAEHKLWWSSDNGATWKETPDTPQPPADNDYADKKLTYLVKQQLNTAEGCESPTAEVKIGIYLIPTPVTPNISYCEGETANNPINTVTPSTAGGANAEDLVLRWYGTGATPSATYTATPEPVSTATAGKTTYWVSQYNEATDTESSPVPFDVTIYQKPEFTVTAPTPACAPLTVNITDKWTVTNNNVNSFDVSAKYYDKNNNEIAASLAAAIPTVGKENYGIEIAFKMPDTKQGADYCTSEKKPVEVDIRKLEILVADAGTCPNSEANLAVEWTAKENTGILNYEWTVDGITAPANTNHTFKTIPLAGSAGDTYPFSVKVSDGVCTKEALNKTITLGDGPVEWNTSTIVYDNSSKAKIKELAKDNDGYYYTCAEEIEIVTDYISKDEYGNDINNFEWYLNNTPITTGVSADGKSLIVSDMTGFGTRTYRLKYTNLCETFVDFNIKSVPLTVTQSNIPDMELCENDEFKADLNINVANGENPSIEWQKDGQPISGETKSAYTMNAQPQTDVVYSYKVTNRNCLVTGDIEGNKNTTGGGITTILNVSGNVDFSQSQLDTTARVCALPGGGEVEVGLKGVEPSNTILTWNDPNGILQGNGLQITVAPPFIKANANDKHQSEYIYTVTGVNGYCSNKTFVKVLVDEPLSGKIEPVAPICEGKTTILNAESYNAQSYVWTADMDTMPLKQTAIQTIKPPVGITTYSVYMERGLCKKDDRIEVTVTTNPVITIIDSVDIKARRIMYDENLGTQPFEFAVDNRNFDSDATKYDLFFGAHKFYIKDANGCESAARDYIVPAPQLVVPKSFTPNGDGMNDTWEIANIGVYENALITIYDRFGKQLVQYNSSVSGWDGTYLGKDMPATDYWYQIDVPEIDKQYVGHFTLLRK